MQFVDQPDKRNPIKKKNKRSLELVFLDDSPDYCKADRGSGTVGTKGRVCKYVHLGKFNMPTCRKDPNSTNSCDLLCCGRGYDSYTEETLEKCNCKFQWCCKSNKNVRSYVFLGKVVCETCRNQTQVHICK